MLIKVNIVGNHILNVNVKDSLGGGRQVGQNKKNFVNKKK